MRTKVSIALLAAFALLSSPLLAAPLRIAVFVPGVRAGNAIYDGMVRGVERAVAESPGSSLKVYEAGFNQAEWEEKLTSLVASGGYDLLVTSNPSMPALCAKVGQSFPEQRFLCLDGMLAGNPRIHTVLYNQTEQGYVTGYLAGLATTGPLPGANKDKKVGFLIAQHYPVMDKIIAPGFERGLKAVDPGIEVDMRVLGNFYDASKAADLARSMIAAGCDVILPICGSGNEGVYKASTAAGTYAVVFDGDDFARAPKAILGCTVLHQDELAYAKVKAALAGGLPYGKAEVVSMKDGYIEFLDKDPAYLANLPAPLRAKMADLVSRIKSGKLALSVPGL
ncbi:MAG TPA: BMP family ABC transporter substrate-binding protein [Spirochaetales bacterium]|nr:BMP family ABC transporter substrate-binding protein [Spirochaetales bacterium]HRY55595.1 BMP family ABC transporter substrate-binding protein [Spirochaetia bacterium]HRZ63865.1 BMP family ABC transporter substrate-binding protein [Spirochaetia bacterium]